MYDHVWLCVFKSAWQSLALFKESWNCIYWCLILCQKLYVFLMAVLAEETNVSMTWQNRSWFLPHVTVLGVCSDRQSNSPHLGHAGTSFIIACGSAIPQKRKRKGREKKRKEVWRFYTNYLKKFWTKFFPHYFCTHSIGESLVTWCNCKGGWKTVV